ncbi:diaminopimelate epimerase [Paludibacter jiangxiensis]|mgnify:CR=1 FL=1|uniref:Diaminopimelate epimerase n=1 Tax=Paludibacter jiangxiensis TaxID=681398 RepID=A0A170YA50_9BACT|nr:diaminopimelate epimerase [Paludibacter jiangxiensis]GAT61631.1 diaminopimelate epimerase [Paludibacter jiangxiensis]
MKFTKMQGAGNDYVYVNGFVEQIEDPATLATAISNRHFGIGSDGLVLILPSETCDFRMRMFNSDGSESEMCGNATRCIGKFVYDKGLTDKTELTLETLAGVKHLTLNIENGKVNSVRVDMGEPILAPKQIPINLDETSVINYPIALESRKVNITAVSMGNPHAVIFMDSLEELDIQKSGPKVEHHPLFPRRTNTEFAQVISPTHIKMRVWERGAGETLACGTGACATAVAAVLNGKTERKVTLELLGGNLEIEWSEADNHVYMTGPAVTVFEGEYLL